LKTSFVDVTASGATLSWHENSNADPIKANTANRRGNVVGMALISGEIREGASVLGMASS
jgi:hypothetical protein